MPQSSSRLRRATSIIGSVALVAAPLAACSDSAGPGGQPRNGSVAMQVTGEGRYVARYTAELSVRGNTAYTSTWGTRGSTTGTASGNAILVWDVSGPTPEVVDSVIVGPNVSTTGDVAVSDDGSLLVVATE